MRKGDERTGGGRFAEVVVPRAVRTLFHYAIPEGMALLPGMRVVVPFGQREIVAYFVRAVERPGVKEVKKIIRPLDHAPLLDKNLLDLTRWISEYYCASWGEVLKNALPGWIRIGPRIERCLQLSEGVGPITGLIGDIQKKAPRQAAILREIAEQGGSVSRATLGSGTSSVQALIKKGLVREVTQEVYRDPYRGEDIEVGIPPVLTPSQERALSQIRRAIQAGGFSAFLLHGVTGSGKTEVYLGAISALLTRGKGALLLVPEIALTAQLMDRVRSRFGREVALLHSGLSDGERRDEWSRVREGHAPIVIGARSALFAPVRDLGLIIVDEEQDLSYRQEEGVRYHARDMALVRGKLAGAVVVLGSATPSLESFYSARQGRFQYLCLSERIDHRPLPGIEIVDLRKEKATGLLSGTLRRAIEERLSRGEQTLLFLNRRGFSPFLHCSECGWTQMCANCSVALTFHKARGLLCHYCGLCLPPPDVCPACRGTTTSYLGVGTEQVEEEVRRAYPGARVARMDQDATRERMAYRRILKAMEQRQIEILVGTQMIAKGHHLPGVTLVGILNADVGLYLPDFRAVERSFELFMQVAGRAGRGDQPGAVVVQTRNPDHYVFLYARAHDYEGFYSREIQYRQELGYPPFSRFVSLLIRGRSSTAVEQIANRVAHSVRNTAGGAVEVLGPAPAPLFKIRGEYRWRVLLKGPSGSSLRTIASTTCEGIARKGRSSGVKIEIDVDPQTLM